LIRLLRVTPFVALLVVAAVPARAGLALEWSTFLGGAAVDYGSAVAIASNGDVIAVGTSASSNFPTTTGAFQRTIGGDRDVVVTRLRSDGTTVVWSTFLGGAAADNGLAVAVGADGDIYVVGSTASTNFPVTTGAYRTAYQGGTADAFVSKLSSDGRSLRYSTYLGGSANELGLAVKVDASNNAYVGGYTGSTNFPTTSGVVKPSRSGGIFDSADGFVTKLNASGGGLAFSTYLGADAGTDEVFGLALGKDGRITVAGMTQSSSFPTTSGAMSRTFSAYWDGFVTRLSADGRAYVYSTFLPGSNYDEPTAVAVDDAGRAYVTGRTNSSNFPVTPGAAQTSLRGGYDGFALALAPDGGSLVSGTYLGGAGAEQSSAIVVTGAGEACVAGVTDGDFPVTPDAFDGSANGGQDAFVCRISAGGAMSYSTRLGGSASDLARGLAIRTDGLLLVSGYSASGAYPTTAGSYDPTQNSPGIYDGFATVLDIGSSASLDAPLAAVGVARLRPPVPNPFRIQAGITLELARSSSVTVDVIDVQGRPVRRLASGYQPAGLASWIWDGRDDSHHQTPAGVYFIRASWESGQETTRIVRLD
jgi:hypothetical protein